MSAREQEMQDMIVALTMARASQFQIDQETANLRKRWAAFDAKPRGDRALPGAAFSRSKRALSKEAVTFWSTPEAERKPEPTEAELRKAISAEHRKLSAEGGDPTKLGELLKRKRAKC